MESRDAMLASEVRYLIDQSTKENGELNEGQFVDNQQDFDDGELNDPENDPVFDPENH